MTLFNILIKTRSDETTAGRLWRVLAHGVAAERGDDRHADQAEGGKCIRLVYRNVTQNIFIN